MKDEADKVTINAFDADHNPALHAEAGAKGLTPWQLFSNRVWATKGLVTGGHYQAVRPQKVTGAGSTGARPRITSARTGAPLSTCSRGWI